MATYNSEEDWRFLEPWQAVLMCRLKIEALDEPLSHCQRQPFGWLSIDLPTSVCEHAPSSWALEWIALLGEGLELFALAAQADQSVWEKMLGVQGFPPEELHVRYRLVVEDQLHGVRQLLTRPRSSSARFYQAKRRAKENLHNTRRSLATTHVPISLVVKPEQWSDCLLGDLVSLFTVAKTAIRQNDDVQYAITEVKLDLLEDFTPVSSLPDWCQFFSAGLPIEAVSLVFSQEWTKEDVRALVHAADQGGVVSITIKATSPVQISALLRETRHTTRLKAVVIDMINRTDVNDVAFDDSMTHKTSSVQSLQWLLDAPISTIPVCVDSIKLNCSTSHWLSTLRACGAQLQSLRLSGGECSSSSVDLSDVLGACPNLQHLEVEGAATFSLDKIISLYDSAPCHLQSLALKDVDVVDAGSVDRLAAALADATSMVSQRLVEFTWLPRTSFVPRTTIDAFERALNLNPQLQCLSLRSKEQEVDQTRFARHHLRRLPGYKLAFLSVLPFVAGNRLNRDVVEPILAFADIGLRRHVVFQF